MAILVSRQNISISFLQIDLCQSELPRFEILYIVSENERKTVKRLTNTIMQIESVGVVVLEKTPVSVYQVHITTHLTPGLDGIIISC